MPPSRAKVDLDAAGAYPWTPKHHSARHCYIPTEKLVDMAGRVAASDIHVKNMGDSGVVTIDDEFTFSAPRLLWMLKQGQIESTRYSPREEVEDEMNVTLRCHKDFEGYGQGYYSIGINATADPREITQVNVSRVLSADTQLASAGGGCGET